MPYPARQTVGFEPAGSITGFPRNPVKYELTPNVAFAKGDMVVLTNSKVALAAAGDVTGLLGVMAETIAQADNPADELTYGLVYDDPNRIYRVTIDIPADCRFDANGGAGDGTTVTALGAQTTANTWRGSLLYVYEGTNAGCVRTVSEFAGDGTTETFTVTFPFPQQCDATTRFIVLGDDDAADRPINVGSWVLLNDESEVDGNGDPRTAPLWVRAIYPPDKKMDVVIRSAAHIIA